MSPNNSNKIPRFRHPDALASRSCDLSAEPQTPQLRQSRSPQISPRPPRRTKGLIRKIIGIAFFAGILIIVIYVAYILSIVAKISTNSWQLGGLVNDGNGRTNILVLGQGDPGHAGQDLTDTMLLLSIDTPGNKVAQISVPRDLRVQIPNYGYYKINAANALGGTDLAEKTISSTLGIPVHYYFKTDFSGMKGLVDAIGGLSINVKTRLVDAQYPCDDNQYKVCGLDIEPGLQHMNGTRVLQYVRCRKGTCGNDFGRAARQQEVIGLIRPKLTDPRLLLHPFELKTIVTAVKDSIHTDLGIVQLLEIARTWHAAEANSPKNLVLSTSPGGLLKPDPAGSSDLLTIGGDYSMISQAIENIFTTTDFKPAQ
jgi:LCP family protein required for cell wall assembly